MTLTWDVVGAFCALMVLICGAFSFIMKLMIKASLSDFLVQLNGTYIRSSIYAERHQEMERRLTQLEERMSNAENRIHNQ